MMSSHEEIVEDAGSIRLSTLDEIVIESRRSSLPIEESAEEQTRSLRLTKFTGEWKVFKHIVFLICLVFLVIQSVEFYYIYRKYPSNAIQEFTVYDDFKVPAVTICFRHTISTEIFCFYNPHLCEKPSNFEEFCKKYPIYCKGNTSNLTIPMNGYLTNFSSLVDVVSQLYLLNDTMDDKELLKSYGRASKSRTFIKSFGRFFKCYSDNLHLDQSESKPENMRVAFNRKRLYSSYRLRLQKIQLFHPTGKPQVFLGLHSSFIPMNPVTHGHAILQGYDYKFQVQLEKEERLLPSPYQTNCREYGSSEDGGNFTNPSSYEMCLEMCESEFSKNWLGCDLGLTMMSSTKYLCYGDFETITTLSKPEEKLEEKRLKCALDCKPDCLKLYYKHEVVKWKMNEEMPSENPEESIIRIFVKNTKVTLIRHVPLYGSGEFFSRIGGLLGCWLGISIFSFSNIIENFVQRAADFKRRLSTITVKSVGAQNAQEAPTNEDLN